MNYNREQLTLRLPEWMKEALAQEAQGRGIGLNQLMTQILRRGLKIKTREGENA
jgi:HicB family.